MTDKILNVTVSISKDDNGYQFKFTPDNSADRPYVAENGDLNFTSLMAQPAKIRFEIDTDLDDIKFKKDEMGMWIGSAGTCPTEPYQGDIFSKPSTSKKRQRLEIRDRNGDLTKYQYALRFLDGEESFACDPGIENGGHGLRRSDLEAGALHTVEGNGTFKLTFRS